MRLFIDIETAPETNVFKGEFRSNAEFIVMDKILRKTGKSPLVNNPSKASYFNQLGEWKKEEGLTSDPVFESGTEETETMPEYGIYNDDFYSHFSLNPEYGRVICISVGYYTVSRDGDFIASSIKCFKEGTEKDILSNFEEFILMENGSKWKQLIAHNGKKFDFPFIAKRMIINGIQVPDILNTANKKPWEVVGLADTMEMWSMGVFGSYSSLEDLCHALDVPSPKNALHGSMVPRAFYDGRIDEICSYCNGDVLAMMKVYHKMTVLGTEKRNLNWIAPKESFA